MSPITRLAPLPPTPPLHRLCPPRSQPLRSITLSLGPSLSSTLLLRSPLARRWWPTRSSPSCVMARPSTARRPMLTCTVLLSTLGRRTSTVPSTTLPPWCRRSGAISAKTMVSYPRWTGQATSLGPSFPKSRFVWLTALPPIDPARYSIIHDIYQHSGSAAESSSVPEQGFLILSVEYQFTYPESPYSSPQLSPIESSSSTNSSLPSPVAYNNVSCLPCLPRNQRT